MTAPALSYSGIDPERRAADKSQWAVNGAPPKKRLCCWRYTAGFPCIVPRITGP